MELARPSNGVFVERPIDFNPPEARRIAAELAQSARLVQDLAVDLSRVRLALDNSWEGNARNRFFDSYEGIPRRVEDFAAELQTHSAQIHGITVTIYERVWIPGPVPE